MSRSISEIYAQAKLTRDQYLQLSEIDTTKLSGSKMSVMNVLTYVMAVLIYTFENTMDIFQSDVADTLSSRINGTPQYYVSMAKKFQPNGTLHVPEDGSNPAYEDKNGKTIITHASYETYPNGRGIILKVTKGNNPTVLDDNEYAKFKEYIDKIKFVGAKITVRSWPADIIIPDLRVVYDDSLITAKTAIQNIQAAINKFIKEVDYDSVIYESMIVDIIQGTEGIEDVPASKHEVIDGVITKKLKPVSIKVKQYNYTKAEYNEVPIEVTSWFRPAAGYMIAKDTINGQTAHTFNATTIELQSKTDYYKENNSAE